MFHLLVLLSLLATNAYGVTLDATMLTQLGYSNESLYISLFNNFDDIDPNAFKGYAKVTSLSFLNSELTKVDLGLFKDMVNLTVLNLLYNNRLNQLTNSKKIVFSRMLIMALSSCPLTSFDSNVTNAFPNLGSFYGDFPFPIKPNQLSPWKNLKMLGVSTKNQTSLTKDHLNGLNSVLSFSFSDSNIKTIEVHSLLVLPNVNYIFLTNNALTSFEYLQIPPKAVTLDLGYNKMNYFMLSRTMGVLRRLILINNLFRSFKSMDFTFLANLTHLHLSNNPHAYPNEIAGHLKPLVNLEIIEISNLSINSIDSNFFKQNAKLQYISLSNNKISVLPFNTFSHLKNLYFIDLSNNQISVLDNRTFIGIEKLRDLRLGFNKIAKIFPSTFNNLSELFDLDLSNNLISEIDSSAFTESYNIRFLNLRYNRLTKISLYNQSLLFYLDLTYNLISKIDSSAFMGYYNLRHLNLDHNQLTKIMPRTFENLTFTSLMLSYNQITELDNSSFSGVKSIESINLSNNNISRIDPATFNGFKITNVLNLSNNQLTKIDNGTFANQDQMISIDLSYNQISTIEAGAFNDLTNLQFIYLQSNNLTQLNNSTFAGCNNLIQIHLGDNPNLITSNLQSLCPVAAVNCQVY